jgi:hypothetical protein
MSGLDTLTHVMDGYGHNSSTPVVPWAAPWTGPTVWVVTEPDYESTDILGVAASIEAAWDIVHAEERCPDGALFWRQNQHGDVYADKYWIVPYELGGVTK